MGRDLWLLITLSDCLIFILDGRTEPEEGEKK